MTRVRVAQIVTTLARGGAQATVLAGTDMADFGIEVVTLAGRDQGGEATYWDEVDPETGTVVAVPHLVRRVSLVEDLRALRWLIRWLRVHQPDVVHTHSSKAGVLGRIAAAVAEVPSVHTVHGWGPLYSTSRVAVAATAVIERLMAGLTMALVVVGEHDLRYGLRHRIGRPGLYRVIRSGIDTSIGASAAQDRAAIRAELGVSDRFVVGMVARLAHPKDPATLVTAFQRAAIADATLLVIGDGPDRPLIEDQIVELGLTDRVQLLGFRPDAARLVAAFDVAVLSSHWEGMPRSVVEAAAASVPVVASDVGSVGDVIVDEISGRLVPPGDADALAATLIDAHERPVAYRDMAAVAHRRVEDFSLSRMRSDLADLWHQLASLTDSGSAGLAELSDRPADPSSETSEGGGPALRRRISANR